MFEIISYKIVPDKKDIRFFEINTYKYSFRDLAINNKAIVNPPKKLRDLIIGNYIQQPRR